MIKGFGLLEVFVALTLSLVILSLVIASITDSTKISKKVTDNQQVMESIFHTVDMIRSDLTKCGTRLYEVEKYFDIPLFEYSDSSFKLIYGLQSEFLEEDSYRGNKVVTIHKNDYFKKRKTVLIYNIDNNSYELNEIETVDGNVLILTNCLQNDYAQNSHIVVLRQVEYKLYDKQSVLKRKLDKGYFQPITENVSEFYVTFYPESNSVHYRIEVNQREQIMGYIFLTNMVKK
jgi:type II secretory pathway pseudopilin PulG